MAKSSPIVDPLLSEQNPITMAAQRVRECSVTQQRSLNGWKMAQIALLQSIYDYFLLIGSVEEAETARQHFNQLLKSE